MNGEVYNFADLPCDLDRENRRFRGGSDTEVVLEACEAWGVERAVSKFIVMFAFAFWDVHARRLTLVRDRLGIKPLYWGRSGRVMFFGSQPKAFADHPAWRPVVDRDALAAYLRHAYVPAPHSIFQGIEKLEPGCMVEIDVHGAEIPAGSVASSASPWCCIHGARIWDSTSTSTVSSPAEP